MDVRTVVGNARTLDSALDRLGDARPRWRVVETIAQDEFSHDVVLRSEEDGWAVLEVT